jgi:hypothetical protein
MVGTGTGADRLREENLQVLNLVQALIGSVTPNMRAASLEMTESGVRLHFLFERESPDDREETSDIAFEFEALQGRALVVEVVTTVSTEPSAVSLPGRRVYGRKDPQSSSNV